MRKLVIVITLIFGFTISYSQELSTKFTLDNFETQILNYNPNKIPRVSDKDYNYGIMILKETKDAVKNKPENFNLADYYNILNAFLKLNETEENINVAFKKFIDGKGSCEYILAFESSIKNNSNFEIIREHYNNQLTKCKSHTDTETELDISEYARSNNLNISLVKEIYTISINDQKYRSSDKAKKCQTANKFWTQKTRQSLIHYTKHIKNT